MKSFILVTFFLIYGLSFSQENDTIKSNINLLDEAGNRHGIWIEENLWSEFAWKVNVESGNYYHGKRIGKWVSFMESGKLLIVEWYDSEGMVYKGVRFGAFNRINLCYVIDKYCNTVYVLKGSVKKASVFLKPPKNMEKYDTTKMYLKIRGSYNELLFQNNTQN